MTMLAMAREAANGVGLTTSFSTISNIHRVNESIRYLAEPTSAIPILLRGITDEYTLGTQCGIRHTSLIILYKNRSEDIPIPSPATLYSNMVST